MVVVVVVVVVVVCVSVWEGAESREIPRPCPATRLFSVPNVREVVAGVCRAHVHDDTSELVPAVENRGEGGGWTSYHHRHRVGGGRMVVDGAEVDSGWGPQRTGSTPWGERRTEAPPLPPPIALRHSYHLHQHRQRRQHRHHRRRRRRRRRLRQRRLRPVSSCAGGRHARPAPRRCRALDRAREAPRTWC